MRQNAKGATRTRNAPAACENATRGLLSRGPKYYVAAESVMGCLFDGARQLGLVVLRSNPNTMLAAVRICFLFMKFNPARLSKPRQ